MFNRAVIGGTFDTMHKGHRKILDIGFKVSKSVVIGLTSDSFANRFRISEVLPYRNREKMLRAYLKKFKKPFRIVKINDAYGVVTTDPDFDCIIVSEETLLRAEEINIIRFKKGLEKLSVVVVPLEMAEDGKPISSDRIVNGEIDTEGRVL